MVITQYQQEGVILVTKSKNSEYIIASEAEAAQEPSIQGTGEEKSSKYQSILFQISSALLFQMRQTIENKEQESMI